MHIIEMLFDMNLLFCFLFALQALNEIATCLQCILEQRVSARKNAFDNYLSILFNTYLDNKNKSKLFIKFALIAAFV